MGGGRREYGCVPEEAYREGRRHFLRALLERPAIYANLALRDLLECAARHNLRDAVAATRRSSVGS